ncbi:hypothetical protein BH20CHL4_BH20CHL4_08630 [soil metagenome]
MAGCTGIAIITNDADGTEMIRSHDHPVNVHASCLKSTADFNPNRPASFPFAKG